MSCPKGMIRRNSYTTYKGVYVPSTCIEDRGNPGKGPKLLSGLKEGSLREYGYETGLSLAQRHAALKRAVLAYSPGTVVKKLNAVAVLNKNTNPSLARIFNADKTWVEETFLDSPRRSPRKSRSPKRSPK